LEADMTIYPKEFKLYATAPAVKKTFVSDVQASNPLDCPNCGGMGTMSIFCAVKGPFESPDPSGKQDAAGNFYSNHHDKYGWWVGITYSHYCPVCDGLCRAQPVTSMSSDQIRRKVKNISERMHA